MIVGQHTVIRSSEADDVHFLMQVYEANPFRSSLLDARRELIVPTLDELREVMVRAESGRGAMFAVEDLTGRVRGFCSVRGPNMEYRFAEAIVMLIDETDYALPFTSDIAAFLESQAFERFNLNKLVSHALETETAFQDWLTRHQYGFDGVQREVLYTHGRWLGIAAFSRYRQSTCYAVKPMVS